MFRWSIAAALLAAAPIVAAQTAAEDEARIEELIRREQAVRQVAAGRDATAPAAVGNVASGDVASIPANAAPAAMPATVAAPPATFADPAGEPATPFEIDPAAPIADADALGGDDWQPHDPKAIAIADLGAHVGTAVRVRSLGGRSRVGRIESVGDAGVTLVSPMGGGYAKYTLPYSQITRVERLQR